MHYFLRYKFLFITLFVASEITCAQSITSSGKPAQLDIRMAGEHSIRVTLKPVDFKEDFAFTPALAERQYLESVISLRELKNPTKKKIGTLHVEVRPTPLRIIISNTKGEAVQDITFLDNGNVSFKLSGQPVLGLGEGGPKPEAGIDWRKLPVEFDRLGQLHKMQPRWQADAYGSRNPVAMLIGTEGWGIFMATPWVQVDLSNEDSGTFIPFQPGNEKDVPQTQGNQSLNLGKGLPPRDKIISGLYDFFVFDAHDPTLMMKNLSIITGAAVLPPKWSLGYMQSHRTLEDENQMIDIAETFREKHIPVDAVIYLGTGFTPRGWNTLQPSFDFNPEVFKRDPKLVISDLHKNNVKVVVHMVPWDRDKLPTLHGSIPPSAGEVVDESHILNYWKQHEDLVHSGIDAFWPDEGDWFNLFERIKRHQLYYQGPISTTPGIRPWSLHRNGYLGIAQWGGWVWSGDTESSWKSLEAQIAVGINHSLSVSPFWGSDIGGFFPNPEKTGELYARWFQFGSFCASFRSHGRTWMTSLPWGWGLSDMGVQESNNDNTANLPQRNPLPSEMSNLTIEPICKKYAELRYQLLPYNYTLAWEARSTGLPMMRALWLHYPDDKNARGMGNEYLWGRDFLIAPVFTKGSTSREVYLPKGEWYDWWTNKKVSGGKTISRSVDLETMPIYVRAGAIIPIDPVRQYVSQQVDEPTTIKIFQGANGQFAWYEDDGVSLDYLNGKASVTKLTWDDNAKKLLIESEGSGELMKERILKVELVLEGKIKTITYTGKKVLVTF